MTPQEFFKKDLFAENAGVVLLEVREGYSKAKLEIKPEHLNAGARTQGGAIFTLADLALAAAANSHGTLAFSLSSSERRLDRYIRIKCFPERSESTFYSVDRLFNYRSQWMTVTSDII